MRGGNELVSPRRSLRIPNFETVSPGHCRVQCALRSYPGKPDSWPFVAPMGRKTSLTLSSQMEKIDVVAGRVEK